MTCAQGLLRLLWGGGPKLECYGTARKDAVPSLPYTGASVTAGALAALFKVYRTA